MDNKAHFENIINDHQNYKENLNAVDNITRSNTSVFAMNGPAQLSFIGGVSLLSLFMLCIIQRNPWNSRTSKICSCLVLFLIIGLGIFGVFNF